VLLLTSVVLTEQYKVVVKQRGINWCRRIPDGIDKVSHKPMSLQSGSTLFKTSVANSQKTLQPITKTRLLILYNGDNLLPVALIMRNARTNTRCCEN